MSLNFTNGTTEIASDCISSATNRVLLVGSNAAFLLPMAYILKRVRPIPPDAFWFTFFVFAASTAFHQCDDLTVCGSACLFSDSILLAGDTLLVNEIAAMAMLYPVPRSKAELKAVIYVAYLVVNSILYFVLPTDDGWDMAVFGGGVFVSILIWHFMLRKRMTSEGNIDHFIHRHIHVPSAVLFVVFALGGVTMRIFGNAMYGVYTPLHSSFHVCGALALYFYFRIFDPDPWSWKTMDVCSGMYDIASMDDESYEQDCEDVSVAVLVGRIE